MFQKLKENLFDRVQHEELHEMLEKLDFYKSK